MRSIYDNVIVAGVCGPTLQTGASVTTTGAYVDTKGYTTAALRVVATPTPSGVLSASQGSTLVATLYECATPTGTFTVAKDNTGTPIGVTLAVSTAAVASTTAVLQNGVFVGSARIEGLGLNRLRYLELQIVGLNATLGVSSTFTTFGVIELGRGYVLPTDLVPGGPEPVSNT